jgi:hypothetical protein
MAHAARHAAAGSWLTKLHESADLIRDQRLGGFAHA